MMGLMYLLAFAVYLALSAAIVAWAVRHARMTGKSASIRGWGAALVMWLIPFWDWIPTVVMHKYYCETEAGFWIYKTVEQWKKENPGVLETLVARDTAIPTQTVGDKDNWIHTYEMNERINKVTRNGGPSKFNRWQYESALIDVRTGEVLGKLIDHYTTQIRAGGAWHGWKFWLALDHCSSYANYANRYADYLTQFRGAKK